MLTEVNSTETERGRREEEGRQTDEESESCRTKLKDLKRETGRGETDRV